MLGKLVKLISLQDTLEHHKQSVTIIAKDIGDTIILAYVKNIYIHLRKAKQDTSPFSISKFLATNNEIARFKEKISDSDLILLGTLLMNILINTGFVIIDEI